MNIDYRQFYRGTTNIPLYGSGAYKKDTLVKYEFNTTDEHGNKIMDKMSKEETLQAMKDIRSQYGDSVIVEFSGDGLAALAEDRKGSMAPEDREAMEARNAAFQKDIVQIDKSLNNLPAELPCREQRLHDGGGTSGEHIARHEESRICGGELYPGGKSEVIHGGDGIHCEAGKRRKSRSKWKHGLRYGAGQVFRAWERTCQDNKCA